MPNFAYFNSSVSKNLKKSWFLIINKSKLEKKKIGLIKLETFNEFLRYWYNIYVYY